MKPLLLTLLLGLTLAPLAQADPPLAPITPSSAAVHPIRRGGVWQRPLTVTLTPLSLTEKIKLAGLPLKTEDYHTPGPPTLLNVNTLEGVYGGMTFFSPTEVWGGSSAGAAFSAFPLEANGTRATGSEMALNLQATQANRTYLVDFVVIGYGRNGATLTIKGDETGYPNGNIFPAHFTQDVSFTGSSQNAQHIVFAFTAPQVGSYWFDIFSKTADWTFYSCEITELPKS